MSRKVPIEGTEPILDPFYRYTRPSLGIKLEGRGNGKKTLIINIEAVAKAMHRNPAELSKFLMSMGACGGSGYKGGVLVMNGHKEEEELEKLMKEYTQHFVLCGNCDRPETSYRLKKKVVVQKCDGCGEVTAVGDSPEYEGMVKFIRRQEGEFEVPKLEEAKPEAGTMGTSKGGKGDKDDKDRDTKKKDKKDKKDKERKKDKDKKEKKKDRSKDSKGGDDCSEGSGSGTSGVPEVKDDDNQEDREDEDQDSNSSSPHSPRNLLCFNEAIDAMQSFLRGRPLPSLVSIELRGDSDDPLEQLFIILQAALPLDEIQALPKASQLPTLQHYAKSVLHPLVACVPARWPISVMEYVFALRCPGVEKKLFPLVLHQLYEADVLEEEDILAYMDETHRNKHVHPDVSDDEVCVLKEASVKFVQWLREAEEEDDSTDDEEDDSQDDA